MRTSATSSTLGWRKPSRNEVARVATRPSHPPDPSTRLALSHRCVDRPRLSWKQPRSFRCALENCGPWELRNFCSAMSLARFSTRCLGSCDALRRRQPTRRSGAPSAYVEQSNGAERWAHDKALGSHIYTSPHRRDARFRPPRMNCSSSSWTRPDSSAGISAGTDRGVGTQDEWSPRVSPPASVGPRAGCFRLLNEDR